MENHHTSQLSDVEHMCARLSSFNDAAKIAYDGPTTLTVIKRDGTIVPFDKERIVNAIYKAAESVGGTDRQIAVELATTVTSQLLHPVIHDDGRVVYPKEIQCPVEDIQDVVEKTLIDAGYARTAKSYILYRQKRTDVREMKNIENKIVGDLIFQDASENDDKRENANVDANATMGVLLKVGEQSIKEYLFRNVLKPEHAHLHRTGQIHYHDAGIAYSINCIQLPIDKLLDRGFNTGHGTIRTPSTIGSASTLSCIIIQSNQNEMFGGQSIPAFDYYLAPYVAKSFIRNFCKYLEIACDIDYDLLKACVIKPIDKWIFNHKDRTQARIINVSGKKQIVEYLEQCESIRADIDYPDSIEAAWDYAKQQTDKDTFQAMESLVHNLCTLNSRCGGQCPFSSINLGTDTSEEGRMITKNLFLAQEAGLGNGETAIFPITIMKMKKGITDKGSPNYDLFQLACRVSSKRLFPEQHWG